ncbi:ATP-dependent DNA helicase RecG [Candidatus Odyssella acanthamoebae]|uniref:ATP-dependent DNA helicase RecG n=1 Tax=Candidatus Odyssella acanthamoebae TaxID=91604 RepID=A0A077AVI0_9PROT|nr:ATP-dependent DNA helicase RecG [Candidatus Paracaedibacter acanthamoebae]AIK96406.1 ATP-dependent DNA helicase RecG [Candidatus Paracaedibacter acanthamoebae]
MEQDYLTRLSPLFAPLTTLPGVAGRRESLFKRLLGERAIDALLHFPSNINSYRLVQTINDAAVGETIIIQAEVMSHRPATRRGGPHRVSCYDGHTFFEVVFFHGNIPYFHKILPEKTKRTIIGRVDKNLSRWSITHPEKIYPATPDQIVPTKEVVYPLTTGVTNKCVHRAIDAALSRLINFPEWHDKTVAQELNLMGFSQAIRQLHHPQTMEDLQLTPAHERLIFDELFAHQLALHFSRLVNQAETPGQSMIGTGKLVRQLLAQLPYEPTESQKDVLRDIFEDMAKPNPMTRLIQGDVGSGKTLVALISMVRAIESGFQTAILAPTDILARQHAETIINLADTIGIKAVVLTGREKGKKRAQILDNLAQGKIDLLIGTHALLVEDVQFKNLGLAVIDEQHRFGVEQRLALAQKGNNPDILAMTATPIPRSLQLANFGDMDVSIIREKPAGRQPVTTKVLPLNRLNDVIDGVQRALQDQAKVFWVCPLVEESEKINVSAAVDRYQQLQEIFGHRIGLVHGKMKAADKDAVMEQFVNGDVDILIATTVIEVGVNVPAATIMIIEHAERFGLAQLHQLRGRIGRGERAATCVLLYGHEMSQVGKERLATMRQTNDGFEIAEADLRLRGGGDILGTRQSGLPGFRLADFVSYPDKMSSLLALANTEAKKVLKTDSALRGDRGFAIRLLLEVFAMDNAIKYTRS